ncbi:MAG: methylenetetrahydrofolate reductase [Woeseiaceae bacterium]|nr:methylenetetrahydrofolate reductase [Woeseiaceae bacterium]
MCRTCRRRITGDTVAACRQLAAAGMQAVPHLPARAVRSAAELEDWLGALSAAGSSQLLLIAGDRATAAGPYASTLDILTSGLLLEHGFRRIGVAGHPEGHPSVADAELDWALKFKRNYAMATDSDVWIVTQFVFSSARTIDWLRRVRETVNPLPIRIGLPGPAKLRTLLAYAAQCGVSASARVLRNRPDAARLLGRWTPDGLARDFAQSGADTGRPLFSGFHMFPFGGVTATADWLDSLRGEPGSDALPDGEQVNNGSGLT